MKLEYFYVKGFRRINEAKIICGDATFLIGENNIGKSSVLKAFEVFFETNKIVEEDFFKSDDGNYQSEEIVLETKFINLPEDANNWRGFKGRVSLEIINGQNTNCIYYRKTFYRNNTNAKREMKSFPKTLSADFAASKTLNDFIAAGLDEAIVVEVFQDYDRDKNITGKDKEKLELISEIWIVDAAESNWASNPGGIEGNISIKLPKFLLIPAENRKEEIEGKEGTLQKIMKELFEDVRDSSDNYKQAQHFLNLLSTELNPDDEEQEFGKMLIDVNNVISDVFTNTKIHIGTNLSDPSSSIKPSFEIEMSSNVKTKPERQGMGSIRSTVFALLRYRENFIQRKREEGIELRPLIIGFEEPEMYLHPNAASLMRDKIYELATSSNSKIICTTHSPYMIDLSKKIDTNEYPKQVLNLFRLEGNEELNSEITTCTAFNTTEAYSKLQGDDKDFVKYILKIDDYIAKVFFCKKIIVVEGDTEELLIKETINRLPIERKKKFLANYQIVKARGKATIISLVKYLKILSINPFVVHDKDTEAGATKFNTPILEALENEENSRFLVENTIEDILGYPAPTYEKPYQAFKYITENWGEDWESIQENWRIIFETRVAPDVFN